MFVRRTGHRLVMGDEMLEDRRIFDVVGIICRVVTSNLGQNPRGMQGKCSQPQSDSHLSLCLMDQRLTSLRASHTGSSAP